MRKHFTNHMPAFIGFSAGLASLVFSSFPVISVIAITCSGYSLATFNHELHRVKWQAIAGLILGLLTLTTHFEALIYL